MELSKENLLSKTVSKTENPVLFTLWAVMLSATK